MFRMPRQIINDLTIKSLYICNGLFHAKTHVIATEQREFQLQYKQTH